MRPYCADYVHVWQHSAALSSVNSCLLAWLLNDLDVVLLLLGHCQHDTWASTEEIL